LTIFTTFTDMSDFAKNFDTTNELITEFEKYLSFEYHDKYSYLTSSLDLCGTGCEISSIIKVGNLKNVYDVKNYFNALELNGTNTELTSKIIFKKVYPDLTYLFYEYFYNLEMILKRDINNTDRHITTDSANLSVVKEVGEFRITDEAKENSRRSNKDNLDMSRAVDKSKLDQTIKSKGESARDIGKGHSSEKVIQHSDSKNYSLKVNDNDVNDLRSAIKFASRKSLDFREEKVNTSYRSIVENKEDRVEVNQSKVNLSRVQSQNINDVEQIQQQTNSNKRDSFSMIDSNKSIEKEEHKNQNSHKSLISQQSANKSRKLSRNFEDNKVILQQMKEGTKTIKTIKDSISQRSSEGNNTSEDKHSFTNENKDSSISGNKEPSFRKNTSPMRGDRRRSFAAEDNNTTYRENDDKGVSGTLRGENKRPSLLAADYKSSSNTNNYPEMGVDKEKEKDSNNNLISNRSDNKKFSLLSENKLININSSARRPSKLLENLDRSSLHRESTEQNMISRENYTSDKHNTESKFRTQNSNEEETPNFKKDVMTRKENAALEKVSKKITLGKNSMSSGNRESSYHQSITGSSIQQSDNNKDESDHIGVIALHSMKKPVLKLVTDSEASQNDTFQQK
jgi:hypothetical protein